jgi:hypothetical protein
MDVQGVFPPSAVRVSRVSFHHQQYGRAGCLSITSNMDNGHAWCLSTTSSTGMKKKQIPELDNRIRRLFSVPECSGTGPTASALMQMPSMDITNKYTG